MDQAELPAEYNGKRITVMGLGSFGGGLGAVRFLVERGARVTVTDTRREQELAEALEELRGSPPAELHLGGHEERDFADADLIVVNPAVRRDNPFLEAARSRGIPLSSEMNLFWRHKRGHVVAVTGSNGKSTTTALTHSILSAAGLRTWLGGNIGRSLLPVVDEILPDDWVVLELSSFQLQDLDRLRAAPDVAVVTNFSPNHLDWHGTLDAYRRAKQTIARWQSPDQAAVLNADDAEVSLWPTAARRLTFGLTDAGEAGVFRHGRGAVARGFAAEPIVLALSEWLKLPGRHNLQNALAAVCAGLAVGVDAAAIRKGLETYEPLPHRLQFVGEWQGRRFYNDSLATTPESAEVALHAFTEPIVLLAGGYDKKVDLSEMARAIAERAKGVALMGQTAGELARLVAAHPESGVLMSPPCGDFREAFRWAVEHSQAGDVIVLSPGCASYDWFRNFADRGAQFCRLVEELARDTP